MKRACQPILVGFVVFTATPQKPHTPLQSPGTRLRAFFAVRNQHTVQVNPIEGCVPKDDGFSVVFCRRSRQNTTEKLKWGCTTGASLRRAAAPTPRYLQGIAATMLYRKHMVAAQRSDSTQNYFIPNNQAGYKFPLPL
jgi:hypothetical protein